jgi:hypothetical protein
VKHLSTEKLSEDLAKLYARLIDLGMEYRNGHVCLAGLTEVYEESAKSSGILLGLDV